jgi:hypothetical protein
MDAKHPILVTGSHNSGTTWVGRNLALSNEVGYIHEPFNPGFRNPVVLGPKFDVFFTYISDHNEHLYLQGMKNALSFHYNLMANIFRKNNMRLPRRTAVAMKNWLYFYRYRSEDRFPLMKDPIALFSAEWLAKRFDMRVIVLIRHPAAFVNSIQSKGWRQPCYSLLSQKELVADHLSPFREELEYYRGNKRPIVEEASFMWKLLYTQVAGYRERHPDWMFVRHEDLSLDPVEQFRGLFAYAGIHYTDEVIKGIKQRSGLLPADPSKKTYAAIQRDSRANVTLWKQKLTPKEIELVRSNVQGVSELFYGEEDWE